MPDLPFSSSESPFPDPHDPEVQRQSIIRRAGPILSQTELRMASEWLNNEELDSANAAFQLFACGGTETEEFFLKLIDAKPSELPPVFDLFGASRENPEEEGEDVTAADWSYPGLKFCAQLFGENLSKWWAKLVVSGSPEALELARSVDDQSPPWLRLAKSKLLESLTAHDAKPLVRQLIGSVCALASEAEEPNSVIRESAIDAIRAVRELVTDPIQFEFLGLSVELDSWKVGEKNFFIVDRVARGLQSYGSTQPDPEKCEAVLDLLEGLFPLYSLGAAAVLAEVSLTQKQSQRAIAVGRQLLKSSEPVMRTFGLRLIAAQGSANAAGCAEACLDIVTQEEHEVIQRMAVVTFGRIADQTMADNFVIDLLRDWNGDPSNAFFENGVVTGELEALAGMLGRSPQASLLLAETFKKSDGLQREAIVEALRFAPSWEVIEQWAQEQNLPEEASPALNAAIRGIRVYFRQESILDLSISEEDKLQERVPETLRKWHRHYISCSTSSRIPWPYP